MTKAQIAAAIQAIVRLKPVRQADMAKPDCRHPPIHRPRDAGLSRGVPVPIELLQDLDNDFAPSVFAVLFGDEQSWWYPGRTTTVESPQGYQHPGGPDHAVTAIEAHASEKHWCRYRQPPRGLKRRRPKDRADCAHRRSFGTLVRAIGRTISHAPAVGSYQHNYGSTSTRGDYEEAAAVSSASPRAAAALLRMCIEGLCKKITGVNSFDKAVAALQEQRIPVEIQLAMDVIRQNGNEVLHAGQLYGEDDAATVGMLFKLANAVVAWAITERRELRDLYNQIPEAKRKHLEERRQREAGKE